MAFRDTVEANQQIGSCYKQGIQALKKKHRNKVQPQNPGSLNGSVDIEACLDDPDEGESRWDYMVGYEEAAYFIEVHPADSKHVGEMVKKVNWLKQWLNRNPKIKGLQANQDPFRWVSTNGVHIQGNYKFKLSEHGLTMPQKQTTLP